MFSEWFPASNLKTSQAPQGGMGNSCSAAPEGKQLSRDVLTSRRKRGISLRLFLLLVVTIVAVILVFVIPGYLHHVENGRMTMDIQSVQTMEDVASITYLQDGASGFTRYYYDELTHTCLTEEKRGTIQGYGRSFANQNENAETGAAGIPNLQDTLSGIHDGPQILTVAFDGDQMIAERWTSNTWSYYDWYFMTDAERAQLTRTQRLAIDQDTVLRALTAARNEYRQDYQKLLDKGADPGLAVYNYDPITDTVSVDGTVYHDLAAQGYAMASKPKNLSETEGTDLAGYGVSTMGTGTGAYVASENRYQEAVYQIPAMGEETVTKQAADGSENAVLQVYVAYGTAASQASGDAATTQVSTNTDSSASETPVTSIDTSSSESPSDGDSEGISLSACALWVKGSGYDPDASDAGSTATTEADTEAKLTD